MKPKRCIVCGVARAQGKKLERPRKTPLQTLQFFPRRRQRKRKRKFGETRYFVFMKIPKSKGE